MNSIPGQNRGTTRSIPGTSRRGMTCFLALIALWCMLLPGTGISQSTSELLQIRTATGFPLRNGSQVFLGEKIQILVTIPLGSQGCQLAGQNLDIPFGPPQNNAILGVEVRTLGPLEARLDCPGLPPSIIQLFSRLPEIRLELGTGSITRGTSVPFYAFLLNSERPIDFFGSLRCSIFFQSNSGWLENSNISLLFPISSEQQTNFFPEIDDTYDFYIRCLYFNGGHQIESNRVPLIVRNNAIPSDATIVLVDSGSLIGAPGDLRTIEARVIAPQGRSVEGIPINFAFSEPRSVNLRGARALSPRLTTSSNGTVSFPAALLGAGSLGFTLGAGGLTSSGTLTVQNDSRTVQATPSSLALRPGESTRVQILTQTAGAAGQSVRLSYPPGLSGPATASVNAAGEAIVTVQAQGGSGGNLRIEFGNPAVSTDIPVSLLAVSATPPPALTHRTGLYANAAEPGYGLMLTQAGAKIVVAWYTFGLDGKPLWLLIPGADPQADGSYTGKLFRYRGTPFDKIIGRADVATEEVGSATLRFNGNNLSFAYQLLDVPLQTKQLTRFRLSNAPAPVCAPSNGRRLSSNVSDVWWNPAEPGWGMSMYQEGNDLFLAWYTYGPDGLLPIWVSGQGQRGADGVFRGTLFSPASGRPFSQINNQAATSFPLPTVGQFDLTFDNGETAGFGYTAFNRPRQEKGIVRFNFGSPATNCF